MCICLCSDVYNSIYYMNIIICAFVILYRMVEEALNQILVEQMNLNKLNDEYAHIMRT